MARVFRLTFLILIFAVGYAGYSYVSWVKNWKNADSPFDEVGIDLHSYMPGFVQNWGCAQLKAEFGTRTMPPHGCGSATTPGAWQ